MTAATTDKKRHAVEHHDLQGVETELAKRCRVQRETAMAIWAMVIATVLLALLVCWRCEAQELAVARETAAPAPTKPSSNLSQYCDVYIRAPLRPRASTTLSDGRVIAETRPDWPDWDKAVGLLPVEATESQDQGEISDGSGDHLWLVRLHGCRGGVWMVATTKNMTPSHPLAALVYEAEVTSIDCDPTQKAIDVRCYKRLVEIKAGDKEVGERKLRGGFSGDAQ